MKQSILVSPQHSVIEERPLPVVGPEDVLVRVKSCGVCASELHGWKGDAGSYPREYGHEVAGEVVEVGSSVQAYRPGMRVTGLFQKAYAEYACAAQNLVAPIPEGISYEEALGEPLSCILSGARRTTVELGDTVALVGVGFMGLLMLQAVRLRGAAHIIAIDPRPVARERALQLGADEAMTPEEVPDALKLTEWNHLGKGRGVPVVMECSGTPAGLTQAAQLVREHGTLALVGWHQGGLRQVDVELWNWKAFDVVNAHERRRDYQMDCMRRGLALLGTGRLQTKVLVTHCFGLHEVDRAFAALAAKPAGFHKAIIVPG
jgi:threonine dehydrogenase-like Zn-dependent dehydrogenase